MVAGRNFLILIIASTAPVALPAQEGGAESTPIRGGPEGYFLAEDLKDRQVFNALGKEIGELSNIILQGDRITHATISIGGFIGIGGSEVVVPFEVLTIDGDQITIGTIATADQIESLTTFDPGDFGLAE